METTEQQKTASMLAPAPCDIFFMANTKQDIDDDARDPRKELATRFLRDLWEPAELEQRLVFRPHVPTALRPYYKNRACYTYGYGDKFYYYSLAWGDGAHPRNPINLGRDDLWFECVLDNENRPFNCACAHRRKLPPLEADNTPYKPYRRPMRQVTDMKDCIQCIRCKKWWHYGCAEEIDPTIKPKPGEWVCHRSRQCASTSTTPKSHRTAPSVRIPKRSSAAAGKQKQQQQQKMILKRACESLAPPEKDRHEDRGSPPKRARNETPEPAPEASKSRAIRHDVSSDNEFS
jgi:hypothetical protein